MLLDRLRSTLRGRCFPAFSCLLEYGATVSQCHDPALCLSAHRVLFSPRFYLLPPLLRPLTHLHCVSTVSPSLYSVLHRLLSCSLVTIFVWVLQLLWWSGTGRVSIASVSRFEDFGLWDFCCCLLCLWMNFVSCWCFRVKNVLWTVLKTRWCDLESSSVFVKQRHILRVSDAMWGDEETSAFLFVLGSSVNNGMDSKYPALCLHTGDVSRASPVPGLQTGKQHIRPSKVFLSRPCDAHLIGFHLHVTVTAVMEAAELPGTGQPETQRRQ